VQAGVLAGSRDAARDGRDARGVMAQICRMRLERLAVRLSACVTLRESLAAVSQIAAAMITPSIDFSSTSKALTNDKLRDAKTMQLVLEQLRLKKRSANKQPSIQGGSNDAEAT